MRRAAVRPERKVHEGPDRLGLPESVGARRSDLGGRGRRNEDRVRGRRKRVDLLRGRLGCGPRGRREIEPAQVHARCLHLEEEHRVAVRRGRGRERASGHARQPPGGSLDRIDREEVPDPGRLRRDEDALSVGAPRGRRDGRAGQREFVRGAALGGQRDQAPAAVAVQECRDPAPVRRETRMAPDRPRVLPRPFDRDPTHGAARQIDAHQRALAEAAAHADGEPSVGSGVGVGNIGAARDPLHAAALELPAVEVPMQDAVAVRRTSRKENGPTVRHPARIGRGEAIGPSQRPERPSRRRSLGAVDEFVRVGCEPLFALAAPLAARSSSSLSAIRQTARKLSPGDGSRRTSSREPSGETCGALVPPRSRCHGSPSTSPPARRCFSSAREVAVTSAAKRS